MELRSLPVPEPRRRMFPRRYMRISAGLRQDERQQSTEAHQLMVVVRSPSRAITTGKDHVRLQCIRDVGKEMNVRVYPFCELLSQYFATPLIRD